ncbi:MAG TPA: GerMN domain-containing protein [Egibacteraceae bacterium]|nr:GerMN domain-containing protein [Egibacteraceae bacterium]
MRALAALAGVLSAVAACTSGGGGAATGTPSPAAGPVSTEPTMQPPDIVDLTVYFRAGEGSSAYLVPVRREARIDDDLPRTALQLLLAGPKDTDGHDVAAPLPSATRVLDLRVADGTATVNLSGEVITHAEEANPSPEHEALALAAIVGTLTEFPAIERVRLLVEGRQTGSYDGVDVGRFWGGWGLPEVLVRDDSILSPPADGEGVPALEQFSTQPQALGADTSQPVAVTSVRIRDRTTYLRVVVELENVADPDAPAAVPPAQAYPAGADVVLELAGVAGYDADFAPGQRVEIDDPAVHGITVDDVEGRVRIVVASRDARQFLLHNLSSPTRVVLDVTKSTAR